MCIGDTVGCSEAAADTALLVVLMLLLRLPTEIPVLAKHGNGEKRKGGKDTAGSRAAS